MRVIALILGLFATLLASHAEAQTVLQVPFQKASFYWDAPASWSEPPEAGSTRFYIMNCGGEDVRIEASATSFPVKSVVSGPGTYHCLLYAENTFGRSDPAVAPTFEAGNVPSSPLNMRIVAQ